jgi:hypothetical protein
MIWRGTGRGTGHPRSAWDGSAGMWAARHGGAARDIHDLLGGGLGGGLGTPMICGGAQGRVARGRGPAAWDIHDRRGRGTEGAARDIHDLLKPGRDTEYGVRGTGTSRGPRGHPGDHGDIQDLHGSTGRARGHPRSAWAFSAGMGWRLVARLATAVAVSRCLLSSPHDAIVAAIFGAARATARRDDGY